MGSGLKRSRAQSVEAYELPLIKKAKGPSEPSANKSERGGRTLHAADINAPTLESESNGDVEMVQAGSKLTRLKCDSLESDLRMLISFTDAGGALRTGHGRIPWECDGVEREGGQKWGTNGGKTTYGLELEYNQVKGSWNWEAKGRIKSGGITGYVLLYNFE